MIIDPEVEDEGCGERGSGLVKIIKHCTDCNLKNTYLCRKYVKFHKYNTIVKFKPIEIVLG